MALDPGDPLGPYALTAEIGHGGMGVVYRAEDPRLKRQVAIKLLPPDLTSDATAKQRFLQEAQAASALDHPNICTIYEINETADGQLYLVMAYYEGETLKERIARGPLPVDDAIDIAMQVGKGLAEAHGAGIVHRDIKPANLLVTKSGTVKILDFGLAKLAGSEGVTQTGTTVGTVAYMSPEQARGEEVDHRTDIWSLGVVLYEMLSGQPPFRGENLLAISEAIRCSDPAALEGAASSSSHVVTRALQKDAGSRYQEVVDLVAALRADETSAVAPASRKPEVPSIAVLPFDNMSADPKQEYFCDGIAEDILNALTRVPDLRVVARTSAFAFKGRHVDVREIGDKLGVTHVLEGSVRRARDRIRVTAQLIEVTDGYHLWSERFDRDVTDVFDIQDEISLAVVGRLKAELLPRDRDRITKRSRGDIEAYRHCLLGRHHWHRFTEQGMTAAVEQYEQALALDADSPRAHGGLADVFLASGGAGLSLFRGVDALPKAKRHAEMAIALDPSLGKAYGTLGLIRTWYELDFARAEEAMERGISVDPGSALVLTDRSHYLNVVGRHDEAIGEIQRAIEVDPISPLLFHIAGWHLYNARRFDEAFAFYEHAVGLHPDFIQAHWTAAVVLLQQDRAEEAVTALESVRSRWPSGFDSLLGYAYGRAGRHSDAKLIANEISDKMKDGWGSAAELSVVHLGSNDAEAALGQLEAALDEAPFARNFCLAYLGVDPIWDPLRPDPRFQALLRRMNFPETAASS